MASLLFIPRKVEEGKAISLGAWVGSAVLRMLDGVGCGMSGGWAVRVGPCLCGGHHHCGGAGCGGGGPGCNGLQEVQTVYKSRELESMSKVLKNYL